LMEAGLKIFHEFFIYIHIRIYIYIYNITLFGQVCALSG
jgi:hypothetical protein